MIGELFRAAIDEIVGDDPATRRAAALPYLATKYNAYAHGVADTLSNVSAAPSAAPTLDFNM